VAGEAEKGDTELAFFEKFAKLADLGVVPGSAQKMLPPAPDILCRLENGERVAFELAEACAPEFNAEIARLRHGDVGAVWGDDVSDDTVRKKLRKRYNTEHPVELLLYRNGASALPDLQIIGKVEGVLGSGLGQFRRVWFLGDALHCIAVAES